MIEYEQVTQCEECGSDITESMREQDEDFVVYTCEACGAEIMPNKLPMFTCEICDEKVHSRHPVKFDDEYVKMACADCVERIVQVNDHPRGDYK